MEKNPEEIGWFVIIMIVVRISGGLGNQMFEYAVARWLKANGKDIRLDISIYEGSNRGVADAIHNGFELQRIFKVDVPIASRREINKYSRYTRSAISRVLNKVFGIKKSHICRNSFGKGKWYFPEMAAYNNIYLDGYWCSFQYADDIEADIRQQYTFPAVTDERNMRLMAQIVQSNAVSIHVRHGDYLKLQDRYMILNETYYLRAMQLIENTIHNPVFYCFSDDIEWCKKHISAKNIQYIDWNTGNSSYIDMQLMSYCKHNIIANSTFSMWAAWLNSNPEKMIICPETIFVDKSNMPSDMYPNTWIKLKI